jgi:glycosyltransferase involved in cell wall biosynthesis
MYRYSINFNFINGPHGGANQFLRGFRKYLQDRSLFSNCFQADMILVNSHHKLLTSTLFKLFLKKKIIHRIDGPIYLIRNTNTKLDEVIHFFSLYVADGLIFQTNWSRNKNIEISPSLLNKKYTTLLNVTNIKPLNDLKQRKNTVVIASWSNNEKKGRYFYEYLDRHLQSLDFDVVYFGNVTSQYKNIQCKGIVSPEELVQHYSKAKIFLSASSDDPCSNAVIEARNCNLVTVCKNSGGHPEITSNPELLFSTPEEMIKKLVEGMREPTIRQEYPKSQETYESYVRFSHEVENNYKLANVIKFLFILLSYYIKLSVQKCIKII